MTPKLTIITGSFEKKISEGLKKIEVPGLLSFNTFQYGSSILVEFPESEMYPGKQSMLADLFIQYDKLIIRTHSEYMIRRLRVLTKAGKINSGDVVFYDFGKNISKIQININGATTSSFNTGLLDESDNLTADLYELPNRIQVNPDGFMDNDFRDGLMNETDKLMIEFYDLKCLHF